MAAGFISASTPVILQFPGELRLLPGQEYALHTGPLFTVTESSAGQAARVLRDIDGRPALRGTSLGTHNLTLRIFGVIPVRAASVEVVPQVEVVPGGQAVGVLLSSSGLLVVRTIPVIGSDGKEHLPARDAGIRPGDVLLKVGDQQLQFARQVEEVAAVFGARGLKVPVEIRRAGKVMQLEIEPVLGEDPAGRGTRYLLGLYLKDPAAGVGTLTFWDPASRRYGALGHMITDDNRERVIITDGSIVPAYIHGIQPGAKGRPGEKMGLFQEGEAQLGNIDNNTPFGIYGTLAAVPVGSQEQPVAVALAHDVKPGPAEILTVLDGQQVERFDIEILAVNRQAHPNGKGLVIKVTDPRLIRRTNGIVQGMSGSPILQDNRLVGAVTHVYVNDPLRGYGLLAEWMVYEAGIRGNPGVGSSNSRRPAA